MPTLAVDRDKVLFFSGMVFAASQVAFAKLVASFGGPGVCVGFMS